MSVALCTAMAQNDRPPVVIATAELHEVVEQVPVSGTVHSPRVARLSPAVAGRVEQVLVEAGDHVASGAPMVSLDAELARLAVDAAAAATTQAREELADARRRLADSKRLYNTRGIAETEVRARETEVRIAVATVELREAEQRSETERLRRHELTAPFAGVITQKLTESGEWVTPGDTVLELITDEGLRIDFRVPQDYFPRVTTDTATVVRLDALGDHSIPARIDAVVPISDPSARTFVIRVYPNERDLPLIPGMSASATLQLGTGQREVVVSRDALLRHPDGRITAWLVEREGERTTVVERAVSIGLAFDGQVAILNGLSAGAQVVVEGNEALRQGQQVEIHGKR
jgi:RND family efflux transporter MFP subunit